MPDTHDRVFNVHGRSARRELVSKPASATLALNDPPAVLVLGKDDTVDAFLEHLATTHADLARIARLPERAVAGEDDSPLTVPRNFGSKEDTTLITELVRRGQKNPDGSWNLRPGEVETLVMLDPYDEDYHRYLHLLLNSCPEAGKLRTAKNVSEHTTLPHQTDLLYPVTRIFTGRVQSQDPTRSG